MFKKLWRAAADELSAAVDKLQAAWPVERAVKALAPVLSIAAGAAAAWTADHCPGLPPIDPGWLAGIFGLAAAGTLQLINKIIDGWQQREKREHEAEEAEKQRASDLRIAALRVVEPPTGAMEDAQTAAAQQVVADVEATSTTTAPPGEATPAAAAA